MKRIMHSVIGAALVPALVAFNLQAAAPTNGYVDFGNLNPPNGGGDYVEVNISSTLIGLAARLVEKQEPDAAKLLNGLHQVHVNVVGLDDQNREEVTQRIQKVRNDLDRQGWERIVVAKKEGKDVGVYLKTQNKDTVQGLAVVVMDGDKQAVFINIVGDIKPEQISLLGEKLHIDALKKAGAAAEKAEDNQ
jgi:hypothetical protein